VSSEKNVWRRQSFGSDRPERARGSCFVKINSHQKATRTKFSRRARFFPISNSGILPWKSYPSQEKCHRLRTKPANSRRIRAQKREILKTRGRDDLPHHLTLWVACVTCDRDRRNSTALTHPELFRFFFVLNNQKSKKQRKTKILVFCFNCPPPPTPHPPRFCYADSLKSGVCVCVSFVKLSARRFCLDSVGTQRGEQRTIQDFSVMHTPYSKATYAGPWRHKGYNVRFRF